jgi:hypothetical protein
LSGEGNHEPEVLSLAEPTFYKIIYSAVDKKPEIACKCLKELVGADGFEPSTSWSRTRAAKILNALSGAAYGTESLISPLLVVPNLYLNAWGSRIVGSAG